MYCTKLLKRAFYHIKLSKEIFAIVLLYIIIFDLSYIYWPKQWDFEYFSVLNQLLLPLVGCIWVNACIRDWIESDQREILFFYSKHYGIRQLLDILVFQILIVIGYSIPIYYGYAKWEDVLIEITVCILFQTLYCFGLLMINSSTLVLFVIIVVEIINAMAYLKNVGHGWYLFLKSENMSTQQIYEKYIDFIILSIVIWIIYLVIYLHKNRRGKLWS